MASPRGGSKGKRTHDPIKFLPTLPSTRAKPAWQDHQPTFQLHNKADASESNGFDLVAELTAREPKRRPGGEPKKRRLGGSQDGLGQGGHAAQTSTFQQPKKDRENFRKVLVDIVMQQDSGPAPGTRPTSHQGEDLPPISQRNGSPGPTEKDVLRYYYYIQHGIDTEHVAPMEDSWLGHVKALLSQELKTGHDETIENLSDEMREDYLLSVKKAIVDFVLRDPREEEDKDQTGIPPHREEIAVVPKPWEAKYYSMRTVVADVLHVTNPCMMKVLDMWHVSFGNLRLVDITEFHNKLESMELPVFQNLCMRHIDAAKEKLLKKWFPEVQNIFYEGNKRKQVPSIQDHDRLESFFNCAATLMTQHLQNLALDSLNDYHDLLVQPLRSTRAYEHSGFVLRLVLDEKAVRFEPNFNDFEIVLLNVFDVMIKSVGIIPRVETKLYSEWSGSKAKAFLKPVILDEILEEHKSIVRFEIQKQSERPVEHGKIFDKYTQLITKQADQDIENFLEEEHSFQDYTREVEKYFRLVDEISYKHQKVIRLGMFELHCEDLIRALSKRADALASKLLTRMSRDHQEANKALCEEYAAIAEKALATPANTEQLVEIKEFIHKTETDTIFKLEMKLHQSRERLGFLVDFATLSPAEIRLNSNTFEWHGRMPKIFEQHREIIKSKTDAYQDALKLRRDRFSDELEGYNKQVEEFVQFGDMNEIQRYLKKARNLDEKLQAAQEKIEAFNTEEEHFGWQTTTYPLRQKIINTLKPFLQLYELTVDFNSKYKEWMEGPPSGVDPDVVDVEIGNLWRSLYKLEKGFTDVPNSKKIASKDEKYAPLALTQMVKAKVEDFREHLPLVQTLFNPGLRDRHWEQITDVVGFTIKPDEDFCLAKVVDMGIEQFIPQFETISEAASKEFSLEKALKKKKVPTATLR